MRTRSRTVTLDIRGAWFVINIIAMLAIALGAYSYGMPIAAQYWSASHHAREFAGVQDMAGPEDMLRTWALDTLESAVQRGTSLSSAFGGDVPPDGRYLVVDLMRDRLEAYDEGSVTFEVLIDHGPLFDSEESLQEGSYDVQEKSRTLFSTITLMNMTYHVRFGDRYALHALPTNASGILLDETYPAGSVVLDAPDAARVYEFVATGTPVVVIADEPYEYTPATIAVDATDLPATTARAYAVADLETMQTLLLKNSNEAYPIASVTKLVTAAVASDAIEPGTLVTAPSGTRYTIGDLYYPLFLRSDNEVAEQIAANVGRTTFLTAMRTYVDTLGMQHTAFADPSGLSARNVSSANDLVLFAKHLYDVKRFLLDISRERTMTISGTSRTPWSMSNQNRFAGDPAFLGGKLGFTEAAGQTALSVFTIPVGDANHIIAVVVLGSKDWKQDTRTLLRWVQQHGDAS